jgi:anti-anti-sigma factor
MRPEGSPLGPQSSEPAVEVEIRPAFGPTFAAVVTLRGEHDIATAPEIKTVIGSIAGSVLVDLTDCAFIDSSVIGALISTSQELEREGHFLELLAPPENKRIVRTLEIVQMSSLIVVHPVLPSGDGASAN